MYNEKQKRRFLDTLQNPTEEEKIFNRIESIEEMKGKDICDFITLEILEAYSFMFLTSLEALDTINTRLKKYQKWCLDESLVKDKQNHFVEIKIETLSRCINKAGAENGFITRDDLLKAIKELPNAMDQYILLALFEGVGAVGTEFIELRNLKSSDIKNNIAKLCTGREIYLSDELCNIIYKSENEYIYKSLTDRSYNLVGDTAFKKALYKSAEIDVDAADVRRITKIIRRSVEIMGMNKKYINKTALKNSGMIHMINEEAKKRNVSAVDLLNDLEYFENIKNQYGFTWKKRRYLISEYSCWLYNPM